MANERKHFTQDEFLDRLTNIKSAMAGAGIDVLCLTSPDNIYYATGYDAWSFYTHQMAVIALERDRPLWIGRAMDIPCARATVWMRDDDLFGYSDDYVTGGDLHAMDFVAELMKAHRWDSLRLGLELENFYFTARCYLRLREGAPSARIVDATALVNGVRLVKSPQELVYMREAGAIVSGAMRTAIEQIVPGARECDVCAAVAEAQIRGTDAFGGDPATEIIAIGAGEELSCPHLAWTDRHLAAGTQINIELGGVRRRYNAALSRTVYLGSAPDTLRALADATLEGLHETLEAIGPGVRAEDVYRSYEAVVARHGQTKASRVGYAIGAAYPPTWVDNIVSFWPGDATELRPGMTFHLMCGMWLDESAFVQSETLLVNETGCELLTDYPRGLIEKPVA